MEKMIFTCENCKYTKEETGYLEDIEDVIICPLCDSNMNLEKDEKTDELLWGAIKEEAIKNMKNTIIEISSLRCWRVIEGFTNAKTRIAYRDIFFKAGGVVPESEL